MLALVGPLGSGKSHLATLWVRSAGGRVLDPASNETPEGPALLEDADQDDVPERRLLALIEAVREGRSGPLLITARSAPPEWRVELADLASRLALTPSVAIEDPTDKDLAAVFAKHLGDRGVEAPSTLVDYVVRRIERSFAAAQNASQVLDKIALERKQRITRKLAAEVLGVDALEDGGAQDDLDREGSDHDER
jgi:chromosomal replication initiation ATPase DnaA